MIYLSSFRFPDADLEWEHRLSVKRTCYNTMYPFGILSKKELAQLNFAPLTILYGGNGSGKTTVLNVMARKLGLTRDTPGNSSSFMDDYAELCQAELDEGLPLNSRIITSDDVFDFMLDLRCINEGIDRRREELFEDWMTARHSVMKLRSLDDYDALRKQNAARSKTQSAFVRGELVENTREMSNGESATMFFRQKVQEDALYLLDEPENSLSAARQKELAAFLAESVRYAGCQLIIATHSPFLLCMPGARVYDLDSVPVQPRRWTELAGVRDWYDFFMEHQSEFRED